MVTLFRYCFFTPLVLLVAVFAVLALCIESTPLMTEQVPLSAANVDRVKKMLQQHKPGRLQAGERQTITVSEKELNLLASYLLRRFDSAGAALKIRQGQLVFNSSWDIAELLPDKKLAAGYVNIAAVLASQAGGTGLHSLTLQSLKIGQISLPAFFVEALGQFARSRLRAVPGVDEGAAIIRAIDIKGRTVALTYEWQEGLVEAVKGGFLTPQEVRRLEIYQQFLMAEIARQSGQVSFTGLLEATFRHALLRSQEADPVAENRAAILVLAAFTNGGGLSSLVPEARHWPKIPRVRLRLQGRYDLVLHFIGSAALAVAGGEVMSNTIGLYKEIDDANGGSGFSFKDLTADRAGSRFGELAVVSTVSARRLQLSLAQGQRTLLPSLQGLEESLTQSQFVARYGGVNDPRYQRVLEDISARINNLALYSDEAY